MKAKLVYTGIRVSDLERSIDFYTKVLGMVVADRSTVEAVSGKVVDLRSVPEGPYLELNYYEKGSKFDTQYFPGEGLDHLAFKVDDLEKAINEARELGHSVVLEVQGKTSRWVYIQDPDGNYIELME